MFLSLHLFFLSAFRFIGFYYLFKLNLFLSHKTFLFIVTWDILFYPYRISWAIWLRPVWQRLIIMKLFWVSLRRRLILFIFLQIVRTHDLLSIISKAWQVLYLILVEFQLFKCWYSRRIFYIAFSMFLYFCVKKLFKISSKKVNPPLTLYLSSKLIDDIHYLFLTHMFVFFWFLFPLFCFLAFGYSRSWKSTIGCWVLTVPLKLISLKFLFMFICFALLRGQKGKYLILEFRFRFLWIEGRSTFFCCLSES